MDPMLDERAGALVEALIASASADRDSPCAVAPPLDLLDKLRAEFEQAEKVLDGYGVSCRVDPRTEEERVGPDVSYSPGDGIMIGFGVMVPWRFGGIRSLADALRFLPRMLTRAQNASLKRGARLASDAARLRAEISGVAIVEQRRREEQEKCLPAQTDSLSSSKPGETDTPGQSGTSVTSSPASTTTSASPSSAETSRVSPTMKTSDDALSATEDAPTPPETPPRGVGPGPRSSEAGAACEVCGVKARGGPVREALRLMPFIEIEVYVCGSCREWAAPYGVEFLNGLRRIKGQGPWQGRP